MRAAVVYCDGSALATGGPGGIAAVSKVVDGAVEVWQEGAVELRDATNQKAEILAAAYGLNQLDRCDVVTVYSDSQYVVKGMTEWMPGWVARGWETSAGRPVANRAYWERLLDAVGKHGSVSFRWVRGHNGHEHNERADVLAGEARRRAILAARAAA